MADAMHLEQSHIDTHVNLEFSIYHVTFGLNNAKIGLLGI